MIEETGIKAPIAQEAEVQRFKTSKVAGRKVKLPTITETVRTGFCSEHPLRTKLRSTSHFIGVNENGWIFFCNYGKHYFVNQAPVA